MTKILLYPKRELEEHVMYQFNEAGLLTGFEIHKTMTEEQFRSFCKLLPFNSQQLDAMLEQWRKNEIKFKVEHLQEDLTFERFYNSYHYNGGEKRNKVRAEKVWNRMGDGDRTAALNYIAKYAKDKKNNRTAMMYPDTYLNNRVWMD